MGLFKRIEKMVSNTKRAYDDAVAEESVSRVAAEKRRDEQKRFEKLSREANDEWEILQKAETKPQLVVPNYDLTGFSFENKEYVCKVNLRYDAKTGTAFPDGGFWYADRKAINAFSKDVFALEDMLDASLLGLRRLPTLRTDFSLVHGVTKVPKELPRESVTLTLAKLTPTGKKPKYPVSIRFSAYEPSSLVANGDGSIGTESNGSHGTLDYFPSGKVGKADIYFWHKHIMYAASFRTIDGEISVSKLEYSDNSIDESRSASISSNDGLTMAASFDGPVVLYHA